MAEYNIPASSDHNTFAAHIARGRDSILAHLSEKYPGMYELDYAPSRLFPAALLDTPQAKMFGCSPDFNAYDLGAPIPRIDPDVHIAFRERVRLKHPAHRGGVRETSGSVVVVHD